MRAFNGFCFLKITPLEKSEAKIQQEIGNWFINNYGLKHSEPKRIIFAIANGGKRDLREAKSLKLQHVKAGIPDMQIILENGRVVWVEVKTEKGVLSAVQKLVMQDIEDLGHHYLVVRSLEDFKNQIKKYL